MKINLLAFGAHPDDVELSCSGTLYQHKQMGYTTGVIDLTEGELGTRGNAKTRLKEATHAKDIMQLDIRENLGLRDGFFEISEEALMKVIVAIRRYRPDIILCNAYNDRHPDHSRGGDLIQRASFLSGLIKIETFDEEIQQEPWRPKVLYRYVQDNYIIPDLVVDITSCYAVHREAILAYRSQFYNESSMEPHTPISTKEFMAYNEARCREYGRQIGVTFAEGFSKCRYLGVKDLFHLL